MPAREPDNSRVRRLPDAKLIFCSKPGCGCHYLDRCPTHGPDEDEDTGPITQRNWPPYPWL